MDTILPSYPERYSVLLYRSLILYIRSFSKSIIFSLLMAVIVFIPRLISDILGHDILLGVPEKNYQYLWQVLIDVIALTFSIAIYWHMRCVIVNVNEPLAEDARRGIKKIASVFIGSLIQGLILIAVALVVYGLLFLLYQQHMLGGVNTQLSITRTLFLFTIFVGQFFLILYVATLFIFLVPIIVIENQGILHALEKSASLVWNHWWRTFSLQVTPWICYLLVMIIIKYVLGINIHIYFMDRTEHLIWTSLLQIVLFTLFIPWVAAVVIVQLRDLELRKEIHKKLNEEKIKHKHP